jgi:hypothetical protein
MTLFNAEPTNQKKAFKYGHYLIVPFQKARFDWFGFIVDYNTKDRIHYLTAFTLDHFIESGIDWLIDNVEMTDDLKADIKKKYEAIVKSKEDNNSDNQTGTENA